MPKKLISLLGSTVSMDDFCTSRVLWWLLELHEVSNITWDFLGLSICAALPEYWGSPSHLSHCLSSGDQTLLPVRCFVQPEAFPVNTSWLQTGPGCGNWHAVPHKRDAASYQLLCPSPVWSQDVFTGKASGCTKQHTESNVWSPDERQLSLIHIWRCRRAI